MPLILFAIVLGILIYRKAKQAEQNNAQSAVPQEKQERQTAPAPTAYRTANAAERHYSGVSRPGAEGYTLASRVNTENPSAKRPEPQPAQMREKTETAHTVIRPTVKPAGSLYYVSEEGIGSSEGTPSTEGECIEENPQHCAVEHLPDDVYDADTGFANDFDRRKLLNAMIMGEVLNAPKWKTN